jgi:hypothetical protein
LPTQKRALRGALLVLWSFAATALTFVLGGAPLRLLRKSVSESTFWLVCFGIVGLTWGIGFVALAAAFLTNVLLIGIFTFLEEKKFSIFDAGISAITLVGSVSFVLLYFWAKDKMGSDIQTVLIDGMQIVLSSTEKFWGAQKLTLKPEDLVSQIPGIWLIVSSLSIVCAVLIEPASVRATVRKERLSDFKLPDYFIWFFIGSLLATFGKIGAPEIENIGTNILNVSAFLYFLQGLAVLGRYFLVFRVSTFWRVIWVLLFVVQMPMLLGIIGIVDYWVDFRKMMSKRAAQVKKNRTQE